MPQALTSTLSAAGTLNLIPSILALMAVQRQAAASKLASPSSREQHFPDGGFPITTLTSPRRSMQTPSFNVSLGQKGFVGAVFGMHVPQPLVNVAKKRKEKVKTIEKRLLAAIVAGLKH